MNKQKWLATENAITCATLNSIVTDYDDAKLTREDAMNQIAKVVSNATARVYDTAFTDGLVAADLDGDSTEEIDVEFEDDDETEDKF